MSTVTATLPKLTLGMGISMSTFSYLPITLSHLILKVPLIFGTQCVHPLTHPLP